MSNREAAGLQPKRSVTTPEAEALLGVTRARLYQLAMQHPGLKLGRSQWDAGIVATLAKARAQRREATAVLKGGHTQPEMAATLERGWP